MLTQREIDTLNSRIRQLEDQQWKAQYPTFGPARHQVYYYGLTPYWKALRRHVVKPIKVIIGAALMLGAIWGGFFKLIDFLSRAGTTISPPMQIACMVGFWVLVWIVSKMIGPIL